MAHMSLVRPRSTIHGRASALLLAALALLGGCKDPPVDSNSPTPTGVIEGSILYIGPKPTCDRDPTTGDPTAIQGRFILTLSLDANPLPPEGTAQAPVDVLAVAGQYMFTLDECLPLGADPLDQANWLQRTVGFRWAEIPLADGSTDVNATVGYRIAGFWDHQGDWNPLFAVQQSNNHGDIAGAALQNPTAAIPKYQVITFNSVQAEPLGQLIEGINVSMGAGVVTDADAFYVSTDGGDISSEAAWPATPFPQFDPATPVITFRLFGRNAADPDRIQLDRTMEHVGLQDPATGVYQVDFANPLYYAWYIAGFDIDQDGQTTDTLHPIWGALPFSPPQWKTPVVFLQRYRNSVETQAGVPSVAMIPLIDPSETHQVLYPTANFLVPSVAAVSLNDAIPGCQTLYLADGSPADVMNAAPTQFSGPATCEEFPTGYYGVNVISGNAGGTVQTGVSASVSQTGLNITGGQLANQLWRLPNELGVPAQVGDAPDCGQGSNPQCYTLPSQSLQGSVIINDPNTNNPGGYRERGTDTSVCDSGPTLNLPSGTYNFGQWANDPSGAMGPDAPTRQNCCEGIRHLCNVPLCPYVDASVAWSTTVYKVRGQPTSTTTDSNGNVIPNCVSFPMPYQCCEGYAN